MLLFAAAIAACDRKNEVGMKCADLVVPGVVISPPGIDVQIRDPFGRGQAIGSTVIARSDGTVEDRTDVRDTLNVLTAYSHTGTFTVQVSRPYYRDAIVNDVVVRPEGCTVATTTVPVTLELLPGAPPLRSMIIVGAEFLSPGLQAHLLPHFDADPGVSTAVTWSLSDASLATIDGNGVVTAKCTRDGGTETVTATSVADASISATARFGVAGANTCP
jgi:hypothetical protein